MLTATHTPCFLVNPGDGAIVRKSLRDLLVDEGSSASFSGPTPFLEVTQLMVAASVVADYLSQSPDEDATLDEVARDVVVRMDASQGRHRLDGDGPRYLQVRLPEAASEAKGVAEADGELFPNFGMLGKNDGKFNFGMRRLASRDGFCPCCALLGLNFVSKFSGGTGGKVAGPWKAGILTVPVFQSLRDTILLNAMAWTEGFLDQDEPGSSALHGLQDAPWEVSTDPWADEAYLHEVVTSGTFRPEFRTVPHLRALTPWAIWLDWGKGPATCCLCGLSTDEVVVGLRAPKKTTGYPGKLGWPKIANAKGEMVSGVAASPWTPVRQQNTSEVSPIVVPKSRLLNVVTGILGDEPARSMRKFSYGGGRLLIAGIFNSHQGADSYAFVVHVPLRPDEGAILALVERCRSRNAAFEDQVTRLRAGLFTRDLLTASVSSAAMEQFLATSTTFVEFLGPEDQPRWEKHILSEALRTYDRVTRDAYQSMSMKGGVPLPQLAVKGRRLVSGAIPLKKDTSR